MCGKTFHWRHLGSNKESPSSPCSTSAVRLYCMTKLYYYYSYCSWCYHHYKLFSHLCMWTQNIHQMLYTVNTRNSYFENKKKLKKQIARQNDIIHTLKRSAGDHKTFWNAFIYLCVTFKRQYFISSVFQPYGGWPSQRGPIAPRIINFL